MKKTNLILMSLFALSAGQQLQAIDFTSGLVALLLGSTKYTQTVIAPSNNAHKDLDTAAEQGLHNLKPYNVGFKNMYTKSANDDAVKNNAYYALRGSYKLWQQAEKLACDDRDDCKC